jgi:hypothetical protein
MNIQVVYRTRLLDRLTVFLQFKPLAFRLMELERQDPLEVTRQIAQNKTGYPGPWSSAEAISLDIDQLGAPTIDDADANTAGRLWIK